ncbi:hypothetical protein ACFX2H_027769 [Malus domestica]
MLLSASPPAAVAWALTSLTTSLIEASKVKSSKSSTEIEKVSKPKPSLFTFQLLILLEQTNVDALQLIHFLLQTFVDLQYALKFKPIDDSLEVDHLVISSNQLFIFCSKTKLKNDMLKILNLRREDLFFPPSTMPFMILSMRAQPILAYPSFFPLGPASKRPAYPIFQQPMRPTISSFLSIASLARVRSKSPKDMSYAARLALRPSTTIRDPSRTSCLWFKPSQAAQAVVPTTTSPRPMPSQLLAPTSRRAAPPQRLPCNSTIQEKGKKN